MTTRNLPLQFTWKISRGQSTEKQINLVHYEKDGIKTMGEMAGITTDTHKLNAIGEDFLRVQKNEYLEWESIQNLDIPSHLRFAMSSALTHWQAQKKGQSLCRFLGLQDATPLKTSFSMPILGLDEMEGFFKKFDLQRFSVLKLKISDHEATEACQELARLFDGPLRIDANEAFSNSAQVVDFLKSVKQLPIQFVEEPLPRGSVEEYKKLKKLSPFPIFADESIQDQILTDDFREQFHGINVKLMKAGSYQRARQQIEKAVDWGLNTMLGCMVETSLGIAGALSIADGVDHFDLDGFLYFKDEPFGLVTENQGELTYRQGTTFPKLDRPS